MSNTQIIPSGVEPIPADFLADELVFTEDTLIYLRKAQAAAEQKAEEARHSARWHDNRAAQMRALILFAEARAELPEPQPSTAAGQAPELCVCGRPMSWAPGDGLYHEVEGRRVPAGQLCQLAAVEQAAGVRS